MITEEQRRIAADVFITAARELDFDFIESPFLDDGISAFGYISGYGSSKGTVIDLLSLPEDVPNETLLLWCEKNGYYCSFLNVQPLMNGYRRSYFREMLRDWGRY